MSFMIILLSSFVNPYGALEGQESREIAQEKPLIWSDWGTIDNGLQCQVGLPASVEHNDTIGGVLRCRTVSEQLPETIKAINPCMDMYTNFSLHLVDSAGKTYSMKADTRTFGPPPSDSGRGSKSLIDGQPLEWNVSFSPLRRDSVAIPEGTYRALVRYEQENMPNHFWRRSKEEWLEEHFWHGKVETGSVPLAISPESEKEETFFVPKKLTFARVILPTNHIVQAPRVAEQEYLITTFTRDNAEKIIIPVRNGHWIGTSIEISRTKSGGLKHGTMGSLHGGPLVLDEEIDQWLRYYGGELAAQYNITVFETCNYGHPRSVGPGSRGYKVLWQGVLEAKATEEELKNVPIRKITIPFGPR